MCLLLIVSVLPQHFQAQVPADAAGSLSSLFLGLLFVVQALLLYLLEVT